MFKRFFDITTREKEAERREQEALAKIKDCTIWRAKAESELSQVREAWARHWAMAQIFEAENQHLRQLVQAMSNEKH